MIFNIKTHHPVFLNIGDWTVNAKEVVDDIEWVRGCGYLDILCYLTTCIHMYQDLFLAYKVKK